MVGAVKARPERQLEIEVGEDWADFCTPATSSTPVPRHLTAWLLVRNLRTGFSLCGWAPGFEGPPSRMQPTSTGSNDLMDRV